MASSYSPTKSLLLRVSMGMLIAGIIGTLIRSKPRKPIPGGYIPTIILGIIAGYWLARVNSIAPEPYLDEVFHIPQAQKYCQGKYYDWDDKITTPPGLYLLSLFYYKAKFAVDCAAGSLRAHNVIAIILVATMSNMSRDLIEAHNQTSPNKRRGAPFYQLHTSLNIALFPVLFFFSGLYYTDVYSTVVVLLAYYNHLSRTCSPTPSLLSDIFTVLVGIATLFMRQTNVFWVVVYMGGLEVFHAIKTLKPAPAEKPQLSTLTELVRYYAWRYSLGEIHDPPLNIAWIDDWFYCVLSVGIAALCNPFRVLRQIWSYITVLGLFASFVYWNDGVVLGDKSNHVATIHLAQMLYIWPLFAFFSAPLFIPFVFPFLHVLRNIFPGSPRPTEPASSSPPSSSEKTQSTSASSSRNRSTVSGSSRKRSTKPSAKATSNDVAPGPQHSTALVRVGSFFQGKLFYIPYYLGTFALSFLVVRYNTIIHPFTLADNRHYMFYIFRYTILRSPKMPYMLIPVYTVSRWLCWKALTGCWFNSFLPQARECPVSRQSKRPLAFYNRPFPDPTFFRDASRYAEAEGEQPAGAEQTPSKLIETLDDEVSSSTIPPPTSTALLWLLTTSLSLVTAPLVEPRYFILPWVFWRLLVPAWPTHGCVEPLDESRRLDRIPGLGWLFKLGSKIDIRLLVETLWFLLINLVTMYIFLNRPFFWKAEDGALLDNGRVQRFMW